MINRHVFLIGMPGSGKSSLGRRVAANLRMPYVDTDIRIADIMGLSVPDIFAQYGEEAFLTAEENILIQLTRMPPMIISNGGGMIMQPQNRALMRSHGVIVLIDRPIDEIMSDIKLDRRPDLARKGIDGVEDVYWDRISTYRSSADYVLDNSRGFHAGIANLERLIANL